MTDPLDEICQSRILPVVVIDDADASDCLGDALVGGGLALIEVTLRTPAALEAIRRLTHRGDMVVGAGTVTTAAEVDLAVSVGARFVVSPGVSPGVLRRCAEHGVPAIPGVATASDIMLAAAEGHALLKFFPAGASGGLPTLAALAAPFPGVRFVPTGGVDPTNAADYLAHPAVAAVGGTWIAPRAAVAALDGAAITRLTRAAVTLARA